MNTDLKNIEDTKFKQSTVDLLSETQGAPIAVMSHNKPVAYLVPADTYDMMLNELDEYGLSIIAKNREKLPSNMNKINVDDL